MIRQSLGKERAIDLANSNWWAGKPPREIAMFQFFTDELCMPFGEFHKALEETLGRPVWTHELGLNWVGLAKELIGENKSPTMQEIMDLLPREKRIMVIS